MPELKINVPQTALAVAADRAERSGLKLEIWAGQVVEAWVAGERCAHRAAPPAPPTPTPDAEAS